MSPLDKVLGWFGYVADKVRSLAAKIREQVQDEDSIAQLAVRAVDRFGDRLAALEPADAAWLYNPVLKAVVAAQTDPKIRGLLGEEKLAAVKSGLLLARFGIEKADEYFDAQWKRVNPYLEAFIEQAKEENEFGFSKSPPKVSSEVM